MYYRNVFRMKISLVIWESFRIISRGSFLNKSRTARWPLSKEGQICDIIYRIGEDRNEERERNGSKSALKLFAAFARWLCLPMKTEGERSLQSHRGQRIAFFRCETKVQAHWKNSRPGRQTGATLCVWWRRPPTSWCSSLEESAERGVEANET